jgi:hypothetical protein
MKYETVNLKFAEVSFLFFSIAFQCVSETQLVGVSQNWPIVIPFEHNANNVP